MNTKPILAIYPGTFDPLTYGHMDIIKRASKIFSNLIIAPAFDNTKSNIFSLEERVALIENEIGFTNFANKVEVQPFKGLLVDFARKIGASVIIRGLRAASDFEYEFQLSYMNYKLNQEVETMFIPATAKGHFISSRVVKQIAKLGGDVSSFVPTHIETKLKEYYEKRLS